MFLNSTVQRETVTFETEYQSAGQESGLLFLVNQLGQ